MSFNSIRVRLLLASLAMIIAVLGVAIISLAFTFQRHIEKRVESELDKHLTQLVAAIDVTPEGQIELSQDLADPRFQLPLSGLYWQIDLGGNPHTRSRSLWDEKLIVPTPPIDATDAHIHQLAGPDGQQLYSLEKAILLEHQGQEKLFVVTIGLSREEISGTVLSFTRDLAPTLVALGGVLLLATWGQISLGLKPLSHIENAVQDIRAGTRMRVEEDVVDEVKPLTTELNALLEANEKRSREAGQRAADLAHGLRTPLTVLGSLARALDAKGQSIEAEKIRLHTGFMRQQVEWELSKALSSAHASEKWLGVADRIQRLVHVVLMSDDTNTKSWTVDVEPTSQLLITESDFNEIFGNLIENAHKWARSTMNISLQGNQICIEDDGPGVAESDIEKLTERGFSAKNSKSATGLGLAIVKQLTEKNSCKLEFGRSSLGGLKIVVTVPGSRLRHQINLPDTAT
jgi:signal transduction histidine kinase